MYAGVPPLRIFYLYLHLSNFQNFYIMSKFIEVKTANKGAVLVNVDTIAYVHHDTRGRCALRFTNGDELSLVSSYEDMLSLL